MLLQKPTGTIHKSCYVINPDIVDACVGNTRCREICINRLGFIQHERWKVMMCPQLQDKTSNKQNYRNRVQINRVQGQAEIIKPKEPSEQSENNKQRSKMRKPRTDRRNRPDNGQRRLEPGAGMGRVQIGCRIRRTSNNKLKHWGIHCRHFDLNQQIVVL